MTTKEIEINVTDASNSINEINLDIARNNTSVFKISNEIMDITEAVTEMQKVGATVNQSTDEPLENTT